MINQQMDEETVKAIAKIEKLLRLAGSNPNEAEAASAAAKAQELLVAYNLDMAVIEQASGETAKRLDEQISGGMHKYQRRLWQHIAELNWCMYWTQKNRVRENSYQAKRGRKWTHEHRLVGRKTNVITTKNMGHYLEKTIERLCREMLGSERSMQFYSRDAVAYREGIADRVSEKLQERRQELVDAQEKEAREAAQRAAAAGTSLSTSLTISRLGELEEAGNYDFLWGEGAWARKLAREAEREKRWAEEREARAKANREAEAAHAAWAAAHPEEAAKEAAKERARQRAQERRWANRSGRFRFRQTAAEIRQSSGSYQRGYAAGENVSIDQQVDTSNQKRIAS